MVENIDSLAHTPTRLPTMGRDPFLKTVDLIRNEVKDRTFHLPEILIGVGEILASERNALAEFKRAAQDLPPDLQANFIAGFAAGVSRQLFGIEGEVPLNQERAFTTQIKETEQFLRKALQAGSLGHDKAVETPTQSLSLPK